MFIEDLKSAVALEHSELDSEILLHACSYYLTASTIYETLEDHVYSLYPLLTLLGFSAELFLKAFSVDVAETYSECAEGYLLKKMVSTSNKNGHNLSKLLEHYSENDIDLYNYLTIRYNNDTGRDLQKDLLRYSKVFECSRYIFESAESEKRAYHSDVSIVFHLVQSLHSSVISLYED